MGTLTYYFFGNDPYSHLVNHFQYYCEIRAAGKEIEEEGIVFSILSKYVSQV